MRRISVYGSAAISIPFLFGQKDKIVRVPGKGFSSPSEQETDRRALLFSPDYTPKSFLSLVFWCSTPPFSFPRKESSSPDQAVSRVDPSSPISTTVNNKDPVPLPFSGRVIADGRPTNCSLFSRLAEFSRVDGSKARFRRRL